MLKRVSVGSPERTQQLSRCVEETAFCALACLDRMWKVIMCWLQHVRRSDLHGNVPLSPRWHVNLRLTQPRPQGDMASMETFSSLPCTVIPPRHIRQHPTARQKRIWNLATTRRAFSTPWCSRDAGKWSAEIWVMGTAPSTRGECTRCGCLVACRVLPNSNLKC